MGIEEGEVQAKDICNVFNRIVAENCLNLKKEMWIQSTGSLQATKQI
jgi:hypothetical protein